MGRRIPTAVATFAVAALAASSCVAAGGEATPAPRQATTEGAATGGEAGAPSPAEPATAGAGAESPRGAAGPPDGPTLSGPHRPWAISEIGPEHRAALVPRNWRPGCPVALEDLRWLTVAYHGFDGEVHVGPLVVNERVAEDVRWVFRRLFRAGFPINRIALPPRYRPWADRWEDRSNITSAYNCRPATGNPGSWSHHAFGWAVDINPLQNPYVRSDGSVLRRVAQYYRDRSIDRLGMIHEGDVVVRSFDAIGWGWGGRWRTLKDYMHFSLTGR